MKKLLNSGHLQVLKNLFVIGRCPLLGGNLKKIVTFGAYKLCPLFMACLLFGMSTIARFHCIKNFVKFTGKYLCQTEAVLQRCSWEKCSENMQQIYRRIPMLKCDFNKASKCDYNKASKNVIEIALRHGYSLL